MTHRLAHEVKAHPPMSRSVREPAPVILFAYNRMGHLASTVEALAKNPSAESSKLFVFSDGPAAGDEESTVRAIRDYCASIRGFKKVTVSERPRNLGLAENITRGVTDVIDTYGRAIVLEDDIVTSPAFLSYMNRALDFYEREDRVWHISGWNYPIDPRGLPDTFLWRVMDCWGWATWADKWHHFERNPQRLLKHFRSRDIRRFNIDGAYDYWSQVKDNAKGTINTWAVFWYAVIAQHDGLCLNPVRSFVNNIGFDGSGSHCACGGMYRNAHLNTNSHVAFPRNTVENRKTTQRVRKYIRAHNAGAAVVAGRMLRRLLMKKG